MVLRGALADAGAKAVGSVLVGLFRLSVEYRRGSSPGGYEGGSLVAGPEGSWESEAVYRLAWTIGGGDLDEKPTRYIEDAVREAVALLIRSREIRPDYSAGPVDYVLHDVDSEGRARELAAALHAALYGDLTTYPAQAARSVNP
ncbi:hypothetical protein ACFVFJ_49145 [Streptomyces sp. NPDC057717]|uniref:hypothetical protein n=1 Tax=Streptomyces sp. NPDC057717 TaxID=3346224 RepID=UPI0036CB1C82